MRWSILFAVACGSSNGAKPVAQPPLEQRPVDQAPAKPVAWQVPAGWKSEIIPFPLDFAPALAHTGQEELRFPKGFFDPASPEYWSYTFIWRTTDAAALDAAKLGDELTVYFKGLITAVDEKQGRVKDKAAIVARAVAAGARFDLTAHVFDAFKTGLPIDLTGWAERVTCGSGSIWVFVLAPATTTIRAQLDELATAAKQTCDRG